MFKSIENEPGYLISKCGKVWSSRSKKQLKTEVTYNGYEKVKIRGRGYYVHRLVAQAWIGEVGTGKGCKMQVDHIDFNKLNNHADNLQIIDNRDNRGRSNGKHYGAHKTSGGKWMAEIRVNGWLQYLGTYKTQEQAKSRYNIARILLDYQT